MAPPPASSRPLAIAEAQQARAWWAALFAAGLTVFGELAYIFIDLQVHPGQRLLPILRALHAAEAFGLIALLLARRRTASLGLCAGAFVAVALPHLGIFVVAEAAMASSGLVWMPLTGHRLLMLAIGLLAPTGLGLGSALIGAFALEGVLLWYGLGLDTRLQMPWEPWITLVWGGAACGLLAFRMRTQRIERQLGQAQAEAESLERLARLFMAMRDAANTPLQSLQLSVTLLQQRSPENAPLLASMERALDRLRALTQRLASSDPLLVWDDSTESFDAETVLRRVEESLAREVERRRP